MQGFLSRSLALTTLAWCAIGFSGSAFAFSFSALFSNHQATSTSTATAETAQSSVNTQSVNTKNAEKIENTQPSQSIKPHTHKHAKIKKKKHRHHTKKSSQKTNSALIPAITAFSDNTAKPNNEVTLYGGITVSNLNPGNQNIAINDTVTNSYDTNPSANVKGLAGFGYQRLFHLKHDLVITAGPAFYYTNLNTVSGTEHPYVNGGNFDTLNYQYAAYTLSLMAESKLVYEKYSWQPFVTAGIGPSWNKLYNYSEVPSSANSSATANPSVFQNNIEAAFAYEVGAGVQHIFYIDPKHDIRYQTSLAYRYMNFGSGQLTASTISTTGQAIKANTLDTNAIIFSLGAVF